MDSKDEKLTKEQKIKLLEFTIDVGRKVLSRMEEEQHYIQARLMDLTGDLCKLKEE